MDDERAHYLDLTDTISGEGGPNKMVLEGGCHPSRGAKGEIQELGNPHGGGAKPRVIGLGKNGGRRVPVKS